MSQLQEASSWAIRKPLRGASLMAERLQERFRSEWMLGVRLFRADFERLCELMGPNTKLIVGDMLYSSIDEIQTDHGNVIHKIKLANIDPLERDKSITVDFEIGVRLGADNRELDFLKVKEFVASKIHLTAQHPWPWAFAILIGWIVFLGAVYGAVVWCTSWKSDSLSGLVFWGGLLFLAFQLAKHNFTSTIHLVRRHEHVQSTFWARNKDKIIWEGAKYLFGGLLGWFAASIYQGVQNHQVPENPPAVTAPAKK